MDFWLDVVVLLLLLWVYCSFVCFVVCGFSILCLLYDRGLICDRLVVCFFIALFVCCIFMDAFF